MGSKKVAIADVWKVVEASKDAIPYEYRHDRLVQQFYHTWKQAGENLSELFQEAKRLRTISGRKPSRRGHVIRVDGSVTYVDFNEVCV